MAKMAEKKVAKVVAKKVVKKVAKKVAGVGAERGEKSIHRAKTGKDSKPFVLFRCVLASLQEDLPVRPSAR